MVRLFVRGQSEGVSDAPELEKYTSGRAGYAVLEDFCQELVWEVIHLSRLCRGLFSSREDGVGFVHVV